MIKKNCEHCDKEFKTYLKDIKRGWGRFCSHSCSAIYGNKNRIKKGEDRDCVICENSFYSPPAQLKRRPCLTCSKSCAAKLRFGMNSPNWQGGKDYRRLAFQCLGDKTPMCERCDWSVDKRGLVVHHKDRNRKNNLIDNLEILCGGCHRIEHYDDWGPRGKMIRKQKANICK